MTQEDKQLLVQDLSARIPYGVIINTPSNIFYPSNREDVKLDSVFGIDDKFYVTEDCGWPIEECKPCLRPLSSMTENEYDEFKDLIPSGRWCDDYDKWAHWGVEVVAYEYDETDKPYYDFVDFQKLLDWLNSHHFDYRSLIEKGLALEAPKDMYKL